MDRMATTQSTSVHWGCSSSVGEAIVTEPVDLQTKGIQRMSRLEQMRSTSRHQLRRP